MEGIDEQAVSTPEGVAEQNVQQQAWVDTMSSALGDVGIFAMGAPFVPFKGILKAMAAARACQPKLHKWVRKAMRSEAELRQAEEQCLSQIKRIMGCVTRLYNQKSREVMKQASIRAELEQMQELGVFNLLDVLGHETAGALHAGAQLIRGVMLTSLKNAEFQDVGGASWKSRYVAIGCDLRDREDHKICEDLQHVVPASLGCIRLAIGCSLGVRVPPGICLSGDVKGAYLTSPLWGPPCFLLLSKDLWPSHWHAYRHPRTRVWMSMYGMQRGDIDWAHRGRR